MKQYINILAMPGSGGTFLDWSIRFLCQYNLTYTYYNRDIKRLVNAKMPYEVVGINNCHRYKTTHPTIYEFSVFFTFIKNNVTDSVNTFFTTDNMCESLSYTNFESVIQQFPNIKHIIFQYEQKHIDFMYYSQVERIKTVQENNIEYGALYYPKMLNNQLFSEDSITLNDRYDNVVLMEFDTYLNDFNSYVKTLVKQLKLKIQNDRINNWKEQYSKWQEIISINFFNNLDNIVTDIIHGNKHDLIQYNMSLSKLSVLLKKVLFEYNLCFKVSELNPEEIYNTVDLHILLENNTYHNLS